MKNPKSKIQSPKYRGSSLIEVIICMFILAVLLVLYSAALNTATLSKKLRRENIAYHVASKQMETLRGTAYVSLPASGSISDTLLTQLPGGAGTYTVGNYSTYTGVKEIVVTVTWNDGIARSVVMKTLAGTGGINP